MTPEEIVEHDAEWLFKLVIEINQGQGFITTEWPKLEENYKQEWRESALSHFAALNSWGGCMKAEDQTLKAFGMEVMALTDPRTFERLVKCGFLKCVPLPEKLP